MKWLLSRTSVTQRRKLPRVLMYELENLISGDLKYELGGREIILQLGRRPTILGELTGLLTGAKCTRNCNSTGLFLV